MEIKGNVLEKEKYSASNFLKFLIPSLIGLILFIIPLPYGNIFNIDGISPVNIGVGFMSELMKLTISDYIPTICLIIIVMSAVLSITSKFITIKNGFMSNLLNVSGFWLFFRIVAAVFVVMIYFGKGPEFIISEDTGLVIMGLMPSLISLFLIAGFLIPLVAAVFVVMIYFGKGPEFIISEDTGLVIMGLMPSLISLFLIAGFLIPLVLDFGLMDFFGTMISKFMRGLFLVPGRASVDTLSSWLGDATLGIMITNTQYKQGFYTKKESAIIAVCFSLVSLPFSTVIADQLGLMNKFVPFYLTVCAASLVCAIILPRIYPLCKIPNETYNKIEYKEEYVTTDKNLVVQGLENAITRAQHAPTVKEIVTNGLKNIIDIYISLIPLVLAWGTISLALAEFTPIFTWISYPIVMILEVLQIPNAAQAAPAVLVGFTDMFIPSVMVSGDGFAEITKFIIGALSISQLEIPNAAQAAPAVLVGFTDMFIPSVMVSGDGFAEITKFIIGALSISQLVYMTETGAVILKSEIPLKLKDLMILFVIRTAISLLVITMIAHMLF